VHYSLGQYAGISGRVEGHGSDLPDTGDIESRHGQEHTMGRTRSGLGLLSGHGVTHLYLRQKLSFPPGLP
jgi:hypothetical protein